MGTQKLSPRQTFLLFLPMTAWLALGGFEAMRQAPFTPMLAMAAGSIAVPA